MPPETITVWIGPQQLVREMSVSLQFGEFNSSALLRRLSYSVPWSARTCSKMRLVSV
jgi:hypothetical protein